MILDQDVIQHSNISMSFSMSYQLLYNTRGICSDLNIGEAAYCDRCYIICYILYPHHVIMFNTVTVTITVANIKQA